jgi:adhesin transport system membrane fusion protein
MFNFKRRKDKDAETGLARTDGEYQFCVETASEIVRAANQDRWKGWVMISFGGVLMMLIILLWFACFNIEEVTTGSAKIIPTSREH